MCLVYAPVIGLVYGKNYRNAPFHGKILEKFPDHFPQTTPTILWCPVSLKYGTNIFARISGRSISAVYTLALPGRYNSPSRITRILHFARDHGNVNPGLINPGLINWGGYHFHWEPRLLGDTPQLINQVFINPGISGVAIILENDTFFQPGQANLMSFSKKLCLFQSSSPLIKPYNLWSSFPATWPVWALRLLLRSWCQRPHLSKACHDLVGRLYRVQHRYPLHPWGATCNGPAWGHPKGGAPSGTRKPWRGAVKHLLTDVFFLNPKSGWVPWGGGPCRYPLGIILILFQPVLHVLHLLFHDYLTSGIISSMMNEHTPSE